MLPLFAHDQYNTQSIEVSHFNNSAMRTKLWELRLYEATNFLQSIWLIKYILVLEKPEVSFFP